MEDAGFQLLNDEEIIAEVRHFPKDDEEEDNDEVRVDENRTWRIPPIHDWYQQKHPGAALELKDDRNLQTTITRFISGHTRTILYVQKGFSCVPEVQHTPIFSRPSALMYGAGEKEPL
ncbi:hypothetical protein AVEN_145215-1 [Araneus ventricosus]|uniref:Uncharacterized protein n=1 Tax=Araneus ventricosus TaxID=182803 RepID=A0A4Y2FXX8_ARAVE|nr:hypothetical protein AVEN_17611-1 [Araneus ventricosus]GBM45279.1 hypothetical protein AVEN_145215-1 [Araneus ventricosus]